MTRAGLPTKYPGCAPRYATKGPGRIVTECLSDFCLDVQEDILDPAREELSGNLIPGLLLCLGGGGEGY